MQKNSIVLLGTTLTFILMLLFEALKEHFFKGVLSSWQSHWITIIFTSLISLIVGLFTVNIIFKLKAQNLKNEVKLEKIKSIKQVMYIVHYYVNNLANNLQIIRFEIEEYGTVRQEILLELDKQIFITAKEMHLLSDIENPFDENKFKVFFKSY